MQNKSEKTSIKYSIYLEPWNILLTFSYPELLSIAQMFLICSLLFRKMIAALATS